MKIRIAKTAGFCFGVRRAVNKVLDELEKNPHSLYTLGPLIHNPQVVRVLERRGVKLLDDNLKLDPPATVVIRSHGITPEKRRRLSEKGYFICDATCPRVSKVQGIAGKYAREGFLVVVLGDPGHSEVEGIKGYAEGRALVIQSCEDIEKLPFAKKVLFIAQTTQDEELFKKAKRAIERKYSYLGKDDLKIENTICDSTQKRQEEVRRLAKEADAVVVVGGKESANTRRLKEIAEEEGARAFLVESEADLDFGELGGYKEIALTAGASTPNWILRRVYESLRQYDLRRRNFFLRAVYNFFRILVISNIYLALGGVSLTLVSFWLRDIKISFLCLVISFCYLFSLHNYHLLNSPEVLELIEPARSRFFEKNRGLIFLAVFLSLIIGAICSAFLGLWLFLCYLGILILGVLYRTRTRLAPISRRFAYRSLRELPGSKDFFSAIGWAVVGGLFPFFSAKIFHPALEGYLVILLIFFMVFVRSILNDFRDLQADRLIGKETLPIFLGPDFTRKLLYAVSIFSLFLILIGMWLKIMPISATGFALGFLYALINIPLFTERPALEGIRAETLIDTVFILIGIFVGLIHYLSEGF